MHLEVSIFLIFLIESVISNEQVRFHVFKHYGNFNSKTPLRIQDSQASRNLILLHDSKQVRIFDFLEDVTSVYISMIDSDSIEARRSTFYKVNNTQNVITTAYLLVYLYFQTSFILLGRDDTKTFKFFRKY